MAKEIQDQFADVDIFDDLPIREQPEGMKVVDALLDLKNRLNLQQGDSLSENIDNAIESLMLEEINKRQNFLRVRKNPEMPEKQSYILEKELPVDVFDRTTVYAKEKRIPFQSETVPEVGVQFVKKFQEGGATELPSLQEQYQDEDIFDTESRLARITEGLEPGARVEPVELTPAEERVAGLAGLLQKGGEKGVPLLGTFEDPRQAYQMSQKLLRLVDPRQQGGIGEFLPGFSYELARERKDPLGQGLSLLDLIPGGGLIKPGVKASVKATKEAIEKADKGIKSLPAAQQKIQQEVDELAKTPNKEFTSPTLKGLLESAPRNLKGQALIDWTRANANKGIKPKEVEVLDLENYIKANPDQNVKEVVQGVKDKQISISKGVYSDAGENIKFDVTQPKIDPTTGKAPEAEQILMEKSRLQNRDDISSGEFVRYVNGRTTTRLQPFEDIDELEDFYKAGNITKKDFDGLIEDYAKDVYRRDPFEMVTIKGKPEITEQNLFAYGNDTEGYLIYSNGEDITNKLDPPFSRTEAQIQLQKELDNMGFRNTGEGATRYKDFMDESLPGGSNYREVVFRLDNVQEAQFPKHDITPHFYEDDAVSHALIRDRKLADGTDTLHIDELQSDLHSAGAQEGYVLSGEAARKASADLKKSFEIPKSNIEGQGDKYIDKIFVEEAIGGIQATDPKYFTIPGNPNTATLIDFNDLERILARHDLVQEGKNFPTLVGKELRNAYGSTFAGDLMKTYGREGVEKMMKAATPMIKAGPIPDYPFKDDWYVMSIKQLLADAVQEGKGAISVSTSTPIKFRYTDDYSKFYENLYDQKIPSAMKKLANRYGGKFKKTKLDEKDTFGSLIDDVRSGDELAIDNLIDLHGRSLDQKYGLNDLNEILNNTELARETNTIIITPEMREKILKEGLDTFGTGGAVSNLGKAIENVDIFS